MESSIGFKKKEREGRGVMITPKTRMSPKEVRELFDKFPNIMKEPTKLPPLCDIQHIIELVPGLHYLICHITG